MPTTERRRHHRRRSLVEAKGRLVAKAWRRTSRRPPAHGRRPRTRPASGAWCPRPHHTARSACGAPSHASLFAIRGRRRFRFSTPDRGRRRAQRGLSFFFICLKAFSRHKNDRKSINYATSSWSISPTIDAVSWSVLSTVAAKGWSVLSTVAAGRLVSFVHRCGGKRCGHWFAKQKLCVLTKPLSFAQ